MYSCIGFWAVGGSGWLGQSGVVYVRVGLMGVGFTIRGRKEMGLFGFGDGHAGVEPGGRVSTVCCAMWYAVSSSYM